MDHYANYLVELLKSMSEVYHTWWGLILFTIIEILPVGLIVSLIAALIFKKRKSAMLNYSANG